MPQFKSRSGGHISIYVPWRPDPIEILEGGTLDTSDPAWIEALNGSPEVVEVRQARHVKDRGKGA